MPTNPNPPRPCSSCRHFTGRVTGEFGACLIAETDNVRAPFDTCKSHEPHTD